MPRAPTPDAAAFVFSQAQRRRPTRSNQVASIRIGTSGWTYDGWRGPCRRQRAAAGKKVDNARCDCILAALHNDFGNIALVLADQLEARAVLMYFVLPLWLAAGFADYL